MYKQIFMKKIRLVTASFGNENRELTIKTPLTYKNYTIDQVFYNNKNTNSRQLSLSPRMKGKIPKMMEWLNFPDYDYYIWIDSKFTILDGFMENIFQGVDDSADLYLFSHPDRSSIKDEVNFVNHFLRVGHPEFFSRYKGESMSEQVTAYLSDESFIDNKLFSLGCFMFSSRLVENRNYNLMTDWLLHCTIYSIQDQLSFPYLLHKHKTRYKVYSKSLMKNNFLEYDYNN